MIVHGPHGGTLWTPDHDDPIRVRRMLAETSEEVVASIHGDLRIVDERSRQFLGRVADVEALPKHCAVLETGGGAYVDAARRAVVYELQQPAFDARAVVGPPYHRLLLGARVMHEWGHVAHTAKLIRIADERRSDYAGSAFRIRRSLPARCPLGTGSAAGRRLGGTAVDRAAQCGIAKGIGAQAAAARRRLPRQSAVRPTDSRRGNAGVRAHERAPPPGRGPRAGQRTLALCLRDPVPRSGRIAAELLLPDITLCGPFHQRPASCANRRSRRFSMRWVGCSPATRSTSPGCHWPTDRLRSSAASGFKRQARASRGP